MTELIEIIYLIKTDLSTYHASYVDFNLKSHCNFNVIISLMKLPNRKKASIEREKITNYLLNIYHPEGGPKAKFFRKIGYDESKINEFKEALLNIAKMNEVTKVDESKSKFVIKYIIDGTIVSPRNRKNHNIRTVWSIEKGHNIPRLSTAYRV